MLQLERDEIADRLKRGPGFLLWLGWVIATAMGTASGLLLADSLNLVRLSGRADEVLGLAASGAVTGLVIGLFQAVVLVPYLQVRGCTEWILASIVSRTAYVMALSLLFEPALSLVPLAPDQGVWGCGILGLAIVLTGAAAGLANGLPQMLVLQGRVANPIWWLWASMGAGSAARCLTALEAIAGADSIGLLTGALVGAITGIAMVDLLRHPGPKATWDLRLKPEHSVSRKYREESQPSPEELLERARSQANES